MFYYTFVTMQTLGMRSKEAFDFCYASVLACIDQTFLFYFLVTTHLLECMFYINVVYGPDLVGE